MTVCGYGALGRSPGVADGANPFPTPEQLHSAGAAAAGAGGRRVEDGGGIVAGGAGTE
eukprot:COSAG02_NODE_6308_length_3665_cov_3.449243_4_plen_58_part_00